MQRAYEMGYELDLINNAVRRRRRSGSKILLIITLLLCTHMGLHCHPVISMKDTVFFKVGHFL